VNEVLGEIAPVVLTTWHGQAFLLPVLRPKQFPADVLASKNQDGEIIARTLAKLDCGVIRGSGAPTPALMHQKGAVSSVRAMLTALHRGRTVMLTADFLKDARRVASPGLIALAKSSGRPILPLAVASSRRWRFRSWDETTLTLPFGRTAVVFGEPVFVPRDADEALGEEKRKFVESELNRVTDRAYAIVDGKRG
jgi:lysophospholipid acyltransferase (LPLAT)-like uncharacterized protein